MKIAHLTAREIIDSNGFPTIEAEVTLEDGTKALGQVPSGASTGVSEAMELRDNDDRYLGKGVQQACANVHALAPVLEEMDAYNQKEIDQALVAADGTENKSHLGSNALLAVSMAVCRSAARSRKIPLYHYFGELSSNSEYVLPEPQILVMEGGKHGEWSTDIQEYMVMPSKYHFASFTERLRVGTEIYHHLRRLLAEKKYSLGVGMEGAFCPRELGSNEEAFSLIIRAIEQAGYTPGEQVGLALDGASSEYFGGGEYILKSEQKTISPSVWTAEILTWVNKYPIWSLEDMHQEEEWDAWQELTAQLGGKVQVVGDDLLTTHVARIQKAIAHQSVSAVLIKPNQVGTISETIAAINLAASAGLTNVISHRSGETNDELIADLAVGTPATQCKFGAPVRGERVAKYNRLLRIEEQLTY